MSTPCIISIIDLFYNNCLEFRAMGCDWISSPGVAVGLPFHAPNVFKDTKYDNGDDDQLLDNWYDDEEEDPRVALSKTWSEFLTENKHDEVIRLGIVPRLGCTEMPGSYNAEAYFRLCTVVFGYAIENKQLLSTFPRFEYPQNFFGICNAFIKYFQAKHCVKGVHLSESEKNRRASDLDEDKNNDTLSLVVFVRNC